MQGPVGRKLMILQRTVEKKWRRKRRRRKKCSENVSLEKWRTREGMRRGKDTEPRGDEVDAVSLKRLMPEKKIPENPPKLPDQNHDPPSKRAPQSG